MRIAMIVGGFPKLSETFILNQVTGLLDLGHDVTILARRRLDEGAVHPEVEAYRLRERTRYFAVPSSRATRLLGAASASLRVGLRRPAALLRCVNPRRHRTAYAVLNNVMHAIPFLETCYDAVFCHYGTNGADFVFLKDLFPRMPFVTMFHGGDVKIDDAEGRRLYRRLRSAGDLFLATSERYMRGRLLSFGFPAEKILVHRVGVAVQEIPFTVRTPPAGACRILSVARLVPEKAIDVGVRAVAALRARRLPFRLEYQVIGDGPERPRLQQLVEQLGVSDVVQLLGPLPSTDVLKCMAESQLFLLPSLAEPFGVVLLEAQASGMPVVATRAGGAPEAVSEGDSALLVPPGDVSAMTAALQQLLERPDTWPRMGRRGRAFVESRHDIAVLNARLAGLLAGLTTAEHGGRPGV